MTHPQFLQYIECSYLYQKQLNQSPTLLRSMSFGRIKIFNEEQDNKTFNGRHCMYERNSPSNMNIFQYLGKLNELLKGFMATTESKIFYSFDIQEKLPFSSARLLQMYHINTASLLFLYSVGKFKVVKAGRSTLTVMFV